MTASNLLIPAAAAIAMLLASACAAAPPASSKRPVLRVLFVGNSYTYSTDVPGMMTRIAAARDTGPLIEATFIGNGGYTLARHLKDAKSLRALRGGKYDVAVLQEQSQMPFMYPRAFQAAAAKLDAIIQAAGAKTVLYMTWARKHQPEKQTAITTAYDQAAAQFGATAAPVGPAWQEAAKINPKVSLYQNDRSHPSKLGGYLAACTILATITGSDPRTFPTGAVPGVTTANAKLCHRAVWKAITARKPAQETSK